MRIEFHVHTPYSDGFIPLSLIKKLYKDRLIIVTDHDNISANLEIKKEFPTIIAEEVSCFDENRKVDVIGMFLTELIPGKKYDFREVIDKIHEQGGIAIAPHIIDLDRNGAGIENAKYFDIIEVFNAKSSKKSNELSIQLFKDNLRIIGSDAHIPLDLGTTIIEIQDFDLENPKEFLNNLKTAKFIKMKQHNIFSKFIRKSYRFIKKLYNHGIKKSNI